MQVVQPVKCSQCDIVLEGREQFVGHMIHGHDKPLEQAEMGWKVATPCGLGRAPT